MNLHTRRPYAIRQVDVWVVLLAASVLCVGVCVAAAQERRFRVGILTSVET
jgi:hypothetical protein